MRRPSSTSLAVEILERDPRVDFVEVARQVGVQPKTIQGIVYRRQVSPKTREQAIRAQAERILDRKLSAPPPEGTPMRLVWDEAIRRGFKVRRVPRKGTKGRPFAKYLSIDGKLCYVRWANVAAALQHGWLSHFWQFPVRARGEQFHIFLCGGSRIFIASARELAHRKYVYVPTDWEHGSKWVGVDWKEKEDDWRALA
jgi:hypothetical protein